MTGQTAPSFFERLKNLTTLWRDYSSARGEALPALKPDLPEDDAAKVRTQMQACLEGRGGDVSARAVPLNWAAPFSAWTPRGGSGSSVSWRAISTPITTPS